MTFVNDAPLPLPGMPTSAPALPAFQMTLLGQPQPVRIPERLWRSRLDDPAILSRFKSERYRRGQHQCWPWIGGVSSTRHGSFRAASLHYRFTLSLRDVEELMLARGIVVSHETIRTWCAKFGPEYARGLRRHAPEPGDTWLLDEVFVKIGGIRKYLWRTVDQDGNVLDVLVQSRRNAKAAKHFFGKLMRKQGRAPRMLVTDKLSSYVVAHRELIPSTEHRRSKYLNNRAENSHQPTRQRERAMKFFRSPAAAQQFLAVFQRDLAAFPASQTPTDVCRLPLRNDRPIRHLERRHRRTRRLNCFPPTESARVRPNAVDPQLRSVKLTEPASAAHFPAYAGISPVTHRSGTSIRGEHPARSGNRKLKRALFLSAFAALRDTSYYDRK